MRDTGFTESTARNWRAAHDAIAGDAAADVRRGDSAAGNGRVTIGPSVPWIVMAAVVRVVLAIVIFVDGIAVLIVHQRTIGIVLLAQVVEFLLAASHQEARDDGR